MASRGSQTTAQIEKRLLRERRRRNEEAAAPELSDLDSTEHTRSAQSKKRRNDSTSVAKSGGIQMSGKGDGRKKARALPKSKVMNVKAIVKADAGDAVDESDTEPCQKEDEEGEEEMGEEEEETNVNNKRVTQRARKSDNNDSAFFIGDPVEESEAKLRWPSRYQKKSVISNEDEEIEGRMHYSKARVDGIEYDLYNDVFVQADKGVPDYIGRIIEFFEGIDRKPYFTAQWFFRSEDTVIKKSCSDVQDPKRVFMSDETNDNPLDCIISKIKIVRVKPNIDIKAKAETIPDCDFYYDMFYNVAYSTFINLPPVNEEDIENEVSGNGSHSTISSESVLNESKNVEFEASSSKKSLSLLDLYAGCGGMSTGLCMGVALAGVNLEAKWAVDVNESACESLQYNHPQTHVRNEKAECFLETIKRWKELCDKFNVYDHDEQLMKELEESDTEDNEEPLEEGVYIVDKVINICYGDPGNLSGTIELKFLIRWKGYGPEDDTWEPLEGLDNCQEKLKKFVVQGYVNNILPLPGTVDIMCGGPPCQGISGFNRFRDKLNPLGDEKNQQMAIFTDIVEYLKPKYVLMENVVDILKFSEGYLGRYAIGRLVHFNYQVRLGLMAAGRYGLPQFRMRIFLWGALPTEVLPQFPLPTHNDVVRGMVPTEFAGCVVGFDEETDRNNLKAALLLEDAISDLPEVANSETKDKRPYGIEPQNDFQRFIRLPRKVMMGISLEDEKDTQMLYDHLPYNMNPDDYVRACKIPKRKGANFRDLPGLMFTPDKKKVSRDPNVPQLTVPSGALLVPSYAISFQKGKSVKPFGRLWWDEIVPTVVGRAEPHNQVILHPSQDRVLSIRENARIQGFPDFYKLYGKTKARYVQIGNAVAVPVSRALGCALGRALLKEKSEGALFTLPSNFHDVGQFVPNIQNEELEE